MTLKELMRELRAVAKVHPEAKEAQVWLDGESDYYRIACIRFDQHLKTPRIILE